MRGGGQATIETRGTSTFRRRLASLALLAGLVAGAGCGGDGGDTGTTPRGATVVSMDEYRFSPDDVVIARGTTLFARNDGEIAHNLVIERGPDPRKKSAQLAGTSTFLPGKTERLALTLGPGHYAMVCTIVGHRQLGMVGSLTVR